MGGKIDAYLDCVSPYSYFAIKYLREHRAILESYDIEVEFIPIFLGGINVGSGNKPPFSVPAKAAYGTFDRKRANKYFGVPDAPTPEFFPILSIFPQRCMCYIKDTFPREKYETVFVSLYTAMWQQHVDVSKPALMAEVLSRNVSETEVREIIAAAGTQKYKDKLTEYTKKALDLGAFGAPWFWVRNAKGEEEPFFGSDRFHFMWDYLGLPVQHMRILEKAKI